MRRHRLLLTVALLIPLVAKAATGVYLTTLPPNPPFTPPAPYDAVRQTNGTFWFGSEELWTNLAVGGVWSLNGNSDTRSGYITKLVFWTKNLDWRKKPELIVTARRTDGASPSVAVAHANAVFVTGKTPAMMTGILIPNAGCWEVTGHYQSKTLTYTVLVQP